MIRKATENDLSSITMIYNQAIESRKATADTETLSIEQRKLWFLSQSKERTPIFVYEDCGTVLGYCYLFEYRFGRKAFIDTAEISYYIDYSHHRKGTAGNLVRHTIDAAKDLGYKNLLALLLSCNNGSIALLKKFQFELWGTLPDIAVIDGNVYSHCYYGLKLN
ncbi:MAG: N-acetyltransferase family protein [Defluviitaleaceae bacterium]|nr:N-acetyltransferase family protein [Defluviitaleaceae bacterium]MCL2836547.1 N-acetyltransferase family protein [Defluviitaleaceae bacterium]